MSKDQKNKNNNDVEIVENWMKMIDYIISTMSFWKLNEKWPGNLCTDGLTEIRNQMYEIINENGNWPF